MRQYEVFCWVLAPSDHRLGVSCVYVGQSPIEIPTMALREATGTVSILQMRTLRLPEGPELAHGLASQGPGQDSHPGLKTGLFSQLCL